MIRLWTLREVKADIRGFLRTFNDSALVNLLEAARAGDVTYHVCQKCLSGRHQNGFTPGQASYAYGLLGWHWPSRAFSPYSIQESDARRQRILVPMILAEIRRRFQDFPKPTTTALLRENPRVLPVSNQENEPCATLAR